MKSDIKIKQLAKAAVIAALYAALSLLLKPITFGMIQLRVAEAMSLLVLYTAAAPLGLTVGCILTNIFSPYGLLDAVVGSLATLFASCVGRRIKNKYLAGLPFIVFNALMVGFVISYSAFDLKGYFVTCAYIAAEEALSVYVLGIPLTLLIEKNSKLNELVVD